MSSEPVFTAGGRSSTLQLVRHHRARRLRLRVDPRGGGVRLTLPWHASRAKAMRWAEEQRGWIETELGKLPPLSAISNQTTLPFRGRDIVIDWASDRPRRVFLEDDRLAVGGPEAMLEKRVIRWLKDSARDVLTCETRRYGALADVEISKISIGDARTRWGSCSSSGAIRYNWRLIMAPPEVLEATVAHEVAHRIHMNHSPQFHALVAELFGRDPAPERRWLREHGTSLYWVGSSS